MADSDASAGATLAQLYIDEEPRRGRAAAFESLCAQLRAAPASLWAEVALQLGERGHEAAAASLLQSAVAAFPAEPALRLALARAIALLGHAAEAQTLLRTLLAPTPVGDSAALLLIDLLLAEGRVDAAATAIEQLHERSRDDAVRTRCIELLENAQRQWRALTLCERRIAKGDVDASLLAKAGDLALQVGRFELARERFLAALARGVDINRWFVPAGLADAQRYTSSSHPDFALFAQNLGLPELSMRARASILYALGKAYDDIGDFTAAAASWRSANRIMAAELPWQRAAWRARIAATIAAPPLRTRLTAQLDAVPVFVVGLPRTGTTLVAGLLARSAQVRNRGELASLDYVAGLLDDPALRDEPAALNEAAAIYLRTLRQDDAPARVYVDKNPLNLRHLDLVDAMFPNALIVHCRRDLRDTALSLWGRSFANEEYAFSNDFAAIADVAAGCAELMAHWRTRLARPILEIDYAELVHDPAAAMTPVFAALQLPVPDLDAEPAAGEGAITSASRWQARQPVHRNSLQRWRAYAPYLPELERAFAGVDESATT